MFICPLIFIQCFLLIFVDSFRVLLFYNLFNSVVSYHRFYTSILIISILLGLTISDLILCMCYYLLFLNYILYVYYIKNLIVKITYLLNELFFYSAPILFWPKFNRSAVHPNIPLSEKNIFLCFAHFVTTVLL